mmetsp:Transcript_24406/g.36428  ORF Transcript_24406/g.36428 Transcript_24406/m.36428 type:complete len:316 (-) Transcript_24406:319-1266(-)
MFFYKQAVIALAAIVSISAHPHFAHPNALSDDVIEELSKKYEKHIQKAETAVKERLGSSLRGVGESIAAHPFNPLPGADFSPCPYHNAMASHGFVNRSGRNIPLFELPVVMKEVIGPDAIFAAFAQLENGPQSVHFDSDGTPLINFTNFWNRPGIERDASSMFHDAFFGEETRREIDEDFLQDLFSRTEDEYITPTSLFEFGADRLGDSLKNNPEVSPPYCLIGEFDFGSLVQTLAGFQHTSVHLLDPNFEKITKHDYEQFYRFGKLTDDFLIRHGVVPDFSQQQVEFVNLLVQAAVTACPLQPPKSPTASDEIM